MDQCSCNANIITSKIKDRVNIYGYADGHSLKKALKVNNQYSVKMPWITYVKLRNQ